MIVTDRFVFLHLHKSGGTFVNECLLRFLPDARQIGYHLPRRLVPAAYAHLPVLGFVRNPWSYYVSWYAFQAGRREPNALFRVLSADGALGFEATIRNMLALGGVDSTHLERLVAALPAAYANRGLNLPGFALAPIRGSGLGFYSYLHDYLFEGEGAPPSVGRMERLREDLPAMLASVGQPPSAPMREFIHAAPPRNVAAHGDYAQYYSPALARLVEERDAALIERYGYRFGE